MPNQTTLVQWISLEALTLPRMAKSSAPQNSRDKLFSLGPILAVLPRGSASPDCDDPVYNPETERDINWNCVEMSGAVPFIQRVQQKR